MRTGALGMIETRGLLGAIEAADAALKSASVSLIGSRKVGGGLVTILITGDVAAVRSAVDAACASLVRLNAEFSSHVIPRLDPEVWRIIGQDEGVSSPENCRALMTPGPRSLVTVPPLEPEPAGAGPVPGPFESPTVPGEGPVPVRDGLKRMTVAELRRLARDVGLDTLTRRQIRDANKGVLTSRLATFFDRAGRESQEMIKEKIAKVLHIKRGDEA